MTDKEQAEAFSGEIDAVVRRFVREFDLSAAVAVGVLEIHKKIILDGIWPEEDDEQKDWKDS